MKDKIKQKALLAKLGSKLNWRLWIGVAVLIFIPSGVAAQSIFLEVPIGLTNVVVNLGQYVTELYGFIIGSVGILAAVMIMYNGLVWAAAAGNSEKISKAKDGIISAIVGLVLALGSFTILNLLNPTLTTLPTITPETISLPTECDYSPGTIQFMDKMKLEHPDLMQFMNFNSAAELACIKPELYDALVRVLESIRDDVRFQGQVLFITSANRTFEKQAELYACYKGKTDAGCPDGCSGCSVAAKPVEPPSGHGAGKAMDMGWTGSKYTSLSGGFIDSGWHSLCLASWPANKDQLVTTSKGSTLPCNQDLWDSVTMFNTMWDEAGVHHISIEWWHHQLGASTTSGSYSALH